VAVTEALDLKKSFRRRLSARGYYRVLKVARTIADMTGQTQIEVAQIRSAVELRLLKARRRGWILQRRGREAAKTQALLILPRHWKCIYYGYTL
jgi:Mg-chelatase subunit ChlI